MDLVAPADARGVVPGVALSSAAATGAVRSPRTRPPSDTSASTVPRDGAGDGGYGASTTADRGTVERWVDGERAESPAAVFAVGIAAVALGVSAARVTDAGAGRSNVGGWNA